MSWPSQIFHSTPFSYVQNLVGSICQPRFNPCSSISWHCFYVVIKRIFWLLFLPLFYGHPINSHRPPMASASQSSLSPSRFSPFLVHRSCSLVPSSFPPTPLPPCITSRSVRIGCFSPINSNPSPHRRYTWYSIHTKHLWCSPPFVLDLLIRDILLLRTFCFCLFFHEGALFAKPESKGSHVHM